MNKVMTMCKILSEPKYPSVPVIQISQNLNRKVVEWGTVSEAFSSQNLLSQWGGVTDIKIIFTICANEISHKNNLQESQSGCNKQTC